MKAEINPMIEIYESFCIHLMASTNISHLSCVINHPIESNNCLLNPIFSPSTIGFITIKQRLRDFFVPPLLKPYLDVPGS